MIGLRYSPVTSESHPDELARDEMVGVNRKIVPFIACGDLSGFDADKSYALDSSAVVLAPTQLPINPAYKVAVDLRRQRKLVSTPHLGEK